MQSLSVFIQSLGWTIIHTIWQSLAIWLVFKIADYTLPRQQAKAKYALGLASLLVLTTAFFATFLLQWQHYNTLGNVRELTQLPATGTTLTAHYKPAVNSFHFIALLKRTEHYFPVIAIGYMVGMTLMLTRLLIGSVQYYNLRYKNIIMPEPQLTALLQKLAATLKLKGNIQLKLSTSILVPVMTGWLKPIIILPVAMVANISGEAMEAILLHELAHIRRHDFLVNIFQMIAETVLFFNPLSWYLSRYISREREHCCDDIVIQYTGQPLNYAKTLASIATDTFRQPALALAATGDSKKPMLLFNRIKRITEMKKQPVNYGRLTAALVICGLMLGIIVRFLPANAQPKVKPAKTAIVSKQQTTTSRETDNQDEDPVAVDSAVQDVVTNAMQKAMPDSSFIDSTISMSLEAAQKEIENIDFKQIFASADSGIKAAMPEIRLAMKQAFHDAKGARNYKKEMMDYRKEMADYQKEMLAYGKYLREFRTKDLDKELARYKKDVELYKQDLLQYQKDVQNSKGNGSMPFPPPPPAPPIDVAPTPPPAPPVAPMPPLPPMPPMPSVAAPDEHHHSATDDIIDQLVDEHKINEENFDVLLNKDKMLIDGKKQDEATHKRYYDQLGGGSMHAIKKEKSSTK